MYYYILEEYKVSNELLTEDIYVRATLFRRESADWKSMIGEGMKANVSRLYKQRSSGYIPM